MTRKVKSAKALSVRILAACAGSSIAFGNPRMWRCEREGVRAEHLSRARENEPHGAVTQTMGTDAGQDNRSRTNVCVHSRRRSIFMQGEPGRERALKPIPQEGRPSATHARTKPACLQNSSRKIGAFAPVGAALGSNGKAGTSTATSEDASQDAVQLD